MKKCPFACLSAFAGLAVVLLLAGCAGGPPKDPGYRCPQAGMMRHADQLAVFSDMANPSRESVTVRAQLPGLTYGCRPVPRRGAVEFHLALSFTAERLPAAGALKGISLPYFVAVLGPDGQIVERRRFKVRLTFDEKNKKLRPNMAAADADHTFDVAAPDAMAAGNYRVVAGFELIPAQLRFNQGALDLRAKAK